MVKPKKALKGLISRTEPIEDTKVTATTDTASPARASAGPDALQVDEVHEAHEELEKPVVQEEPEVLIRTKASPTSSQTFPEPTPSPAQDPEHHLGARMANLAYNFEVNKEERLVWSEHNYVSFIRRIDAAQTEAFMLKGKLLEEIKNRFYQDADKKTGWKHFCEETLSLNYTTANQYIRVAQEFDVTSHHRPDFGFEHFKALLPLPLREREALLTTLPEVSVKALRGIVQEKLRPQSPTASPSVQAGPKTMVQMLQRLKMQIYECIPEQMSQAQRWQLSAACRNLAEELMTLAESLNAAGNMMQGQIARSEATARADSLLRQRDGAIVEALSPQLNADER